MRGGRVGWLVRGKGLLLVGALAAVLWVAWPAARAEDREVTDLKVKIASPVGHQRRLVYLEELRKLASYDSRRALEELSRSPDDRVAILALATMGRDDYPGARDKLKGVAEDTTRPDVVRGAAMVAWARLEAKDGASKATVQGLLHQRAGQNARVKAIADAAVSRLWKEGGR